MLVKVEQDGNSDSNRRLALQVLRAALQTAACDGFIARLGVRNRVEIALWTFENGRLR
jgi:hypothetical protein